MFKLPLLLFIYCLLTWTLHAANHIVVLQYHHFGASTPPSTSVTPEQFERHLDYLEASGFTVWSLEKAIHRLLEKKELPDRAVAITIDDAYISVYEEAYPLLKNRNWPFTVFVATEAIDQNQPAFMSWDQMREMSENGVAFAAHSHTHPYLVRQKQKMALKDWKKWAHDEIAISQQRLKKELGSDSRLFAYPYGEYDLDLQKIVADLELFGIGQHSGVIWERSDFKALPRFPVSGEYADLKDFSLKANSLPLPVTAISPEDPVIYGSSGKPVLRLSLASNEFDHNRLACFATQQGKITTAWVDEEKLTLDVIPHQEIPMGRSKYNCTVPQTGSNRFFWYSRQWLRLK